MACHREDEAIRPLTPKGRSVCLLETLNPRAVTAWGSPLGVDRDAGSEG